jgi:drug/metabolite transporter (DMT)-like permease
VWLLLSSCILLPGAAITGRFNFSITNIVWASLVFQILIVCVVGMLLWFWLLTVYQASQLGVLSFLTPVFGIVFGVVLLGEPVEPQFILGAALVLAGIALVSGWQWFAQHAFRKRVLARS